jgi:hypothetical protein
MQIKQHKFAIPMLFSSQLLLEIEGDFAKASSRARRESTFFCVSTKAGLEEASRGGQRGVLWVACGTHNV